MNVHAFLDATPEIGVKVCFVWTLYPQEIDSRIDCLQNPYQAFMIEAYFKFILIF